MQKYGVEEVLPKVAEENSDICPKCGSKLEDQAETGVKKCPECGTKPFEVEEQK